MADYPHEKHSNQPGLEPVMHPNLGSGGGMPPKPQEYPPYGGPPYSTTSPQHSYQSPQHSHMSPMPYGVDPSTTNEKSHTGRHICGLAATTFFLLLAILFLIIAAAVGGGVGGTLAVNNAKTACLNDAAVTVSSLSAALASATSSALHTSSSSSAAPSSTATPAQTATQVWGPVGTNIGYSTCSSGNADGTIYTSFYGPAKYKIYCDKDIPGNDLFQTIVTTMGLCMEACSNWNLSPGVNIKCAGVAYIPSYIDGNGSGDPVDCYLKSVANATLLAPNSYVVDFAIIQ